MISTASYMSCQHWGISLESACIISNIHVVPQQSQLSSSHHVCSSDQPFFKCCVAMCSTNMLTIESGGTATSCRTVCCSQTAKHPAHQCVLMNMQGKVQNQSFYPYYGSAQKLVYEADALSSNVYSSTFTPYTSFSLADTYPPAFMTGYPTAVNINDTTFTLAAAFYEAAIVYYVVMPAASVSVCDMC